MPFVTCATLENRLADKQDQLLTPSGGDLPGGSCVMTCAEVTAAIANSGNVTAGTNVTLSGNGTTATPYVVNVPNADSTTRGAVSLAPASEFPSPTNDIEAATPAYVALAVASAAPVDQFGNPIQGGDCVLRCPTPNGTDGQVLTVQADGSAAWESLPVATTSTPGVVALATAADHPSATNDTDAATPAYVAAAIAALPGDKYLQGLQSYNAATNTLTLQMNDGTTVPVDMSGLVADAVAEAALTDCQGNTLNPGDSVIACPGTAGTAGQVLTVQPDGSSAWATPAAGGLTSVAHDATLTGSGTTADPLSVVSAPKLSCGNWTIECDASGNLVFFNAGTRVAKIEPNGHITSANDVSAFCTV